MSQFRNESFLSHVMYKIPSLKYNSTLLAPALVCFLLELPVGVGGWGERLESCLITLSWLQHLHPPQLISSNSCPLLQEGGQAGEVMNFFLPSLMTLLPARLADG